MGAPVRQLISFSCKGSTLFGTLDEGHNSTALLIVSGGNEIRIGAHRGMARLAQDIAAAGYPVLRFDRRGIGDSEGENGGFESSGPDISAAAVALRNACPHISRIVAFGNCDAASALLLHTPDGIDALLLANIWIIEPDAEDATPPPAAIKSWYLSRMRDPKAWLSLLRGAVNLRKLVGGLAKIAKPAPQPSGLAERIANALAALKALATILLAKTDGTAAVFKAAWNTPAYAAARKNGLISIMEIDSASHSFAPHADYQHLLDAVLAALFNQESSANR